MSNISAAAVAQLRARTGVSILDCKKALEEADGNEELAIEILRKRGQAQAVKKADRAQGEGVAFVANSDKKAAVVVLRNETDFVSRNEDYQAMGKSLAETALNQGKEAAEKLAAEKVPVAVHQLGENISLESIQIVEGDVIGCYVHNNNKIAVIVALSADGNVELARDVAMHTAAMNPQYVRPEEVTEDAVAKEKEIWKEQLAKEGKPEAIMVKIMEGKEKKYREENAVLTQPFVKDPQKTVQQHLGSATVKTLVQIRI